MLPSILPAADTGNSISCISPLTMHGIPKRPHHGLTSGSWQTFHKARSPVAGTRLRFKKGQTMLCEGHTSEHCYEILEGIVRAYKILSDGRRQIINFLFPGESLGIGARDAYRYSADAVTDTTVRSLAKPALERLASGQPALAARLRDSVLRELRAAQDHLVVLGRKTAREKVASFLLFVAEHENPSFNDGHTIWIPMSQRDIADYLGLTTETVNRVMASLRANSIISIRAQGHIRLIMVEALSDIANAA